MMLTMVTATMTPVLVVGVGHFPVISPMCMVKKREHWMFMALHTLR